MVFHRFLTLVFIIEFVMLLILSVRRGSTISLLYYCGYAISPLAKLQTFSHTAKQTDTKIPRKAQHLTGNFVFIISPYSTHVPPPWGSWWGALPPLWGGLGRGFYFTTAPAALYLPLMMI